MVTDIVPTSERLAQALEALGDPNLASLIALVRDKHYDEYEGELATPLSVLVADLRTLGQDAFAQRVIDGEFDGTEAEADAWYEREGKHLVGLRRLVKNGLATQARIDEMTPIHPSSKSPHPVEPDSSKERHMGVPQPTGEPPKEYRLLVSSLTAMRDKEPYVAVEFEGPHNKVQMTIAEARAHAQLVIEAAESAIQDAYLVAFMTEQVGAEMDVAAQLLGEFRAWREKKGF